MVHDGAKCGDMRLPARRGDLFSPSRFPFLEGWHGSGAPQVTQAIEPPLVPDGTVYRVLEKLLVLDGERISYRALDVEQIGSVYETMMGFPVGESDWAVRRDQVAETGRGIHDGRFGRALEGSAGAASEVDPGSHGAEADAHGVQAAPSRDEPDGPTCGAWEGCGRRGHAGPGASRGDDPAAE